jgi:hypothetical protein
VPIPTPTTLSFELLTYFNQNYSRSSVSEPNFFSILFKIVKVSFAFFFLSSANRHKLLQNFRQDYHTLRWYDKSIFRSAINRLEWQKKIGCIIKIYDSTMFFSKEEFYCICSSNSKLPVPSKGNIIVFSIDIFYLKTFFLLANQNFFSVNPARDDSLGKHWI